jgi:hypothetical protein
MQTITIVPAEGGGWMVRCSGLANDLFFRSGSSAEAAAIRVAQGYADAGEPSEVAIYLRDHSLAKRFAVPAGLQPA